MEKHAWILEVLKDIADYAELNGLPKISEMVIDAEIVAFSEISQSTLVTPTTQILRQRNRIERDSERGTIFVK